MSKPFLNLGCGRTHLPGEHPAHHQLIPADIYTEREWVNVDRSPNVGADMMFDLFTYPWPLESDSYGGALLSHLCEHIPHEIKVIEDIQSPQEIEMWERSMDRLLTTMKRDDPLRPTFFRHNGRSERAEQLSKLQDGWFAFFAELYRVLTHDARVHILSPHASTDGALTDPTHTRYLTPMSFAHSMKPDPDAPFEYQTGGIHFEFDADPMYELAEWSLPYADNPAQFYQMLTTQRNMVVSFYVRLRAVKA